MTVIFLDIDGVLQPFTRKRFDHDLDANKAKFAEQDKAFEELDKYDIGAVYFDWDKDAVELMRKLCDATGARFVISSDWRRSKDIHKLKKLFSLHNLGEYIVDTLAQERSNWRLPRYQEIRDYLDVHDEITRFVIIDDLDGSDFRKRFPNNFVQTQWAFKKKDYDKALRILKQ